MSLPLILLFCLLPFYWAYLVFTTQPMIIFDAIGYEQSGRDLLAKGFADYLKVGPSREPLFPLLLSGAMQLEKVTSVTYLIFIKFILLGFLAVTMVGVYRLARMLGAGRNAAGIAALYIGISPMIMNSTLWLWSEAAAYPFVVWALIFCIKSWRLVQKGGELRRLVLYATITACLLMLLTMVKAVVATVTVLFLAPFYIAVPVFLFRKEWRKCRDLLICLGLVLGITGVVVNGYKWLNWRYNGNYVMTNRAEWALFGNTVRRLQPLTKERLGQAFLSVPRLGLCEKVYGRECVYWTYVVSDNISVSAANELNARGYSPEQQRKVYVSSSLKLMAQHPFQQAGLMLVEASKMLFWENRLVFVQYTPGFVLSKLYRFHWVVYILSFGWAILSLAGLIWCVVRAVRKRQMAPALVASFLFFFIGLHSIFFIDIRYGLPTASLFIILGVACLEAGVKAVWVGRERESSVAILKDEEYNRNL